MDIETEKMLASDNLSQLIEKTRKAQEIYSTYTQEQVDKIFQAAAIAANKNRIPLAKEAVTETGMGVLEDPCFLDEQQKVLEIANFRFVIFE